MFNPRPRMKGNLVSACAVTYNFLVSIHALTWRATHYRICSCMQTLGFNPRPHMKGDAKAQQVAHPDDGFNPRPHMKGDIIEVHKVNNTRCFNPRPHMNGDLLEIHLSYIYLLVSIHALT